MAYNDGVKLTAYTFYLQGLAFEEVARKTRAVHKLKSLKGQTVESWADDGGWEKMREGVRTQVRKYHEEEATSLLSQLSVKSETIMATLYEQLTEKAAPKISSYEGAVYAFRAMADLLLSLDKKRGETIQPIMVVHTLLEVFQEIPQIREAIKKHWPKIQAAISSRIGLPMPGASKSAEIDITPKAKDE